MGWDEALDETSWKIWRNLLKSMKEAEPIRVPWCYFSGVAGQVPTGFLWCIGQCICSCSVLEDGNGRWNIPQVCNTEDKSCTACWANNPTPLTVLSTDFGPSSFSYPICLGRVYFHIPSKMLVWLRNNTVLDSWRRPWEETVCSEQGMWNQNSCATEWLESLLKQWQLSRHSIARNITSNLGWKHVGFRARLVEVIRRSNENQWRNRQGQTSSCWISAGSKEGASWASIKPTLLVSFLQDLLAWWWVPLLIARNSVPYTDC